MTLNVREMGLAERKQLLQAVQMALGRRDLSVGQALRVLRAAHLGVDRATFAAMVGVSRRELAKLETDRANPTVRTLEAVFRPFGLRVGLVPVAGSAISLSPDALSAEEYQPLLDVILAAERRHRRSRRGARG